MVFIQLEFDSDNKSHICLICLKISFKYISGQLEKSLFTGKMEDSVVESSSLIPGEVGRILIFSLSASRIPS